MFQLPRKLAARWVVWLKAGRYREEKRILLKSLMEHFQRDFLNASDFYRARCGDHISAEEYEAEKINFVRAWITHLLDKSPDLEQAAAIGAVEGHVQVVARAGVAKPPPWSTVPCSYNNTVGWHRTRYCFLLSTEKRLKRFEIDSSRTCRVLFPTL